MADEQNKQQKKEEPEQPKWTPADLEPAAWAALSPERQREIRAAMHSDVLAGR